ncbi:ATP-binding protein [Solirubrobacter pauli]|uniref:ATP-binding protein n=1 Tax=Solirubrobacter pauli TaxID=166793 RepID=UPI001477186E|nr:ATP-binding protein [Solirubrobacter pauli]
MIELVWNAIDAEATQVQVDVIEIDGAVLEIKVIDDGHGIDIVTAEKEFGFLGDSWKAAATRSKTGARSLHGRAGQGRLSIFKYGGTAQWRTVSELAGSREELTITVRYPEIAQADITDPLPTSGSTGTVVTLSNFAQPPTGIHGDVTYERLLTTFAVSMRVQGVAIKLSGRPLDLADALTHEEDIDVHVGNESAVLTLLEWKHKVKPEDELHLCDADGVSLHSLPASVDGHGLHFTAYLRWKRMPQHSGQLPAASLDSGILGRMIREARRRLQRALDHRRDLRRREIIENWKREGFYPFDDRPPATESERLTRETFDLVAVEAAPVIDGVRGRKARQLSLRLLREALEHNPGQIHRVLEQVLDLDLESVARLDRLLAHTPLSRLISASSAIAGRLEFLGALRDLTSRDVHRKRLLERSQLHKLVEAEPWIFGEEYALAASDRGLTEVLKQHLKYLDRPELAEAIDREVLDSDGHRAIVDLLFSGRVVNADDHKTMLVIELKRPSVSIGVKEYEQLRKYAMGVVDEEQFDLTRTRFEFWAVSTGITPEMRRERTNRGPETGLVKAYDDLPVRLWVKTWAEILHTAEHRLRYVREQLEYEPTQEQSFEYLRRMYADRLPPTVAANVPPEAS